MEKKKKKTTIPIDATKNEMDAFLNKVDITKNPYIPSQPNQQINITNVLKNIPKEYNPYKEQQQKAIKELNIIANQITANATLQIPKESLHEMEQIISNALLQCFIIGKKINLNVQLTRLFLDKVIEIVKASYLSIQRQRGVVFF